MSSSDEISLRDFFSIFRRRQKELLLCWAGTFAAVAVYTALLKPQYRAVATIKVQAAEDMSRPIEVGSYNLMGGSSNGFNPDTLLTPESATDALRRVGKIHTGMKDVEITALVDDLMRRSRIFADDKDPTVVMLSVIDSNPDRAATDANTLAQVAVEAAGAQTVGKTRQAKEFIQQQQREVETRLHDSEDRLREMQQKFGTQSSAGYYLGRLMELKARRTQLTQKYTSSHPEVQQVNAEIRNIEQQLQKLPIQETDMARVSREIRLNEELYTNLTKQLQDVSIIESARLTPATILAPAIPPSRPDRPNKPFNLAAGFVLGILVGAAVVWIRHQLDSSLLTAQDIEAILKLPVLAMVPHIERRKKDAPAAVGPRSRKVDVLGQLRSRLVLNFPAKSPFIEVYHILRTNLPKTEFNGQGQVLLITSAVGGEGKSVTAANFSIAAAQAGIRTLLVEADLRKPMVDKLFGVPEEPGLTNYFYHSPRWENYLAGWEQIEKSGSGLAQAINVNGMANLRLLPSGKLPSNPIALLNAERFGQLLKEMRQRFQLTILDCSPISLFADCTIIAPHADGVILVYRFGRTDREAVRQAHNHLISSKAKVLGVVVNDMQKGESTDYSGYYKSYNEPVVPAA